MIKGWDREMVRRIAITALHKILEDEDMYDAWIRMGSDANHEITKAMRHGINKTIAMTLRETESPDVDFSVTLRERTCEHCDGRAEMEVWTKSWAFDGGKALQLCSECMVKFLNEIYAQECIELSIPLDSGDAVSIICPRCEVWHVLPPPHYFPRTDHDKDLPMTVGDLMKLLAALPRETFIEETGFGCFGKIALGDDSIMVFEKDGVIELHIDNPVSYQGHLDPHRKPILEWYREKCT